MSFHRRCGKRITLTNNNRTAMRNISEFNHGLVLSNNSLIDDKLFEVRIDEKVSFFFFLKENFFLFKFKFYPKDSWMEWKY